MSEFYIPGEAPLINMDDKTANLQAGQYETPYRRQLSAEEYEYYYNQMNSSSTPNAVRAALGVALKSDLLFVYKDFYSTYKDDLVEEWAKKFKELKGSDLIRGRSEIEAFNKMIYSKPIEGEFSEKSRSTRSAYWLELAKAEKAKINEAKAQQLLKEEAQGKTEVKSEKTKAETKKLIRDIAYEFMIIKVREYLNAFFRNHPVSLIMNKQMSDNEYWFRMKLIKEVEKYNIKPTLAFHAYQKALNALQSDPVPRVFKAKTQIYLGYGKHPLERYNHV